VFYNIYLRLLLFLFLFPVGLFANTINVLPLANKSIHYKSKIYSYDVRLVQANKKYKCRKYIDIIKLKENKYFALHYIAKNRAICAKDVYIPQFNTIKFKFGNLEIEREGTILKETDKYIRVKNIDGTIQKIYKDGKN